MCPGIGQPPCGIARWYHKCFDWWTVGLYFGFSYPIVIIIGLALMAPESGGRLWLLVLHQDLAFHHCTIILHPGTECPPTWSVLLSVVLFEGLIHAVHSEVWRSFFSFVSLLKVVLLISFRGVFSFWVVDNRLPFQKWSQISALHYQVQKCSLFYSCGIKFIYGNVWY